MKALVSSFSCSWGIWITLIAVVILSVTPDISLGATSQSAGVTDPPPEKVRQFLDLANNPEVKSWLEGKVAVQAPAAETSIADAISDWGAAVKGRVAAVVGAIDRVPDEIANSSAVFVRDVNAGRPGLVLIIFVALLAVGFGAERLILSVLAKRNTDWSRVDPVQATMSHAVALVTFSLATITLYLLFDWPPLLGKTILLLLVAFILFRLIHGIARLLLAFDGVDEEPENQSSVSQVDTVARFWLRRIDLVAGLTLAGWVVVNVMSSLGFSAEVTKLAAFVLGLGILGIGIEVVWRRPRVTTSVIVRSLLSAYMVLLWLAWVGGLLGLLFVGIYSLVLPGVIRSVGNLAQALASRAQLSGAFGVLLNVVIVRGARALVIAAAVAWLAYAWRFSAAALAGSEIGKVAVNGISNAIVILLVADLFWQSSKALIAYRMELAEHSSDSDHLARSDRLRTLLPIFRNTLAVLIGAIAILTILSGLGVQIAPLLAGAGIFGVAIGFGSQTLVKDVLSGVFYMLDDAFRVGEYIQSGSYKGTVESFSLRSVRLRHHRGPIFTVPFGELGAVENMSRDWVIDKMTINVTYDSDIELARKLIKKIGQELAADPEFAADTLQPLKMQGVDSFGDFAIVLRLKLMTKPNAQFAIKRRAFMMIKKVFDENGIKIAVPTVHVEGSGESAAAAAHQVQQSAKAAQVAEAAGQAVA